MDKQAVFPSDLKRNLAHRFQKRLGLHISNGSSDFCNYHICVCLLPHPVYKLLNLVCNMRNHLHRRAQILSPALLV